MCREPKPVARRLGDAKPPQRDTAAPAAPSAARRAVVIGLSATPLAARRAAVGFAVGLTARRAAVALEQHITREM